MRKHNLAKTEFVNKNGINLYYWADYDNLSLKNVILSTNIYKKKVYETLLPEKNCKNSLKFSILNKGKIHMFVKF